ncbi:MAG: radical SAM protein [Streptococcaceae bacterium]|jgi:radical SAM protein with 4Fe4S-binding SPASM domain|nr:radical SAM protein [Streptococcaceae bacterium]
MRKPELRFMHMDVTVGCNLTCKHCFYGDYNSRKYIAEELNLERMFELILEAKTMGCEKIIFSGGEVLTSPKFFDLLYFCKEKKIKTIFITNATLIDDNVMKKLEIVKDNIEEIKISYEGENNDYVRGSGTGEKIMASLNRFDELGFPWTVNTILNKYNINYLDEVYEFMKKSNPLAWRLDFAFEVGRYKKYKDDLIESDFEYTFKKVAELLKRYLNEKPNFELFIYNLYRPGMENFLYGEKPLDMHPCAYNKRNIGIRGLGEVTPCSRFLALKLGNVKAKSIRDVKNSELYKKFWDIKIKDIDDCFGCKYLKVCGCGCRANAFEKSGSIMRKDPLNCEILPLLEKYVIPLYSKKTQTSFYNLCVGEKNV